MNRMDENQGYNGSERLKAFLDKQLVAGTEPWDYDLIYECLKEENNQNPLRDLDNIKKVLMYNYSPLFEGSHADNCSLSRDIYKALWNYPQRRENKVMSDMNVKIYDGLNDGVGFFNFSPDTMNSFKTIFIDFLQNNNILSEENKKYVEGISRKQQTKVSALFVDRLISGKEGFLDAYLSDMKKLWLEYAKYTHTMGNFVLVPKGFNTKRSNKLNDFWDMSLAYLNEKVAHDIIQNKNFFTNYINYFYLWDYVICIGETYYVKSLLSKRFMGFHENSIEYEADSDIHSSVSSTCIAMPDNKDKKTFLLNCLWAIQRRGAFMRAMLEIRFILETEQYIKLLDDLFAIPRTYQNGYEDVCKKIKKFKTDVNKQDRIKKVIDNLLENDFKKIMENCVGEVNI